MKGPRDTKLHRPPRWLDHLLQWFCADEVVESLQGDLHELYTLRRASKGKFRADLSFFRDVLDSCRPFAFKRRSKSNNSNTMIMYRNYFKVAWRNFRRQKVYTAINIFGLVLGLSAFITIAVYVEDEWKYDRFHPDTQNTYRISAWIISNGQEYREATCQFPLAEALQNDFAGIASTVRFHRPYSLPLLQYKDRKYVEDRFYYADKTFFEVFGHHLDKGDPSTALSDPNSIVMTPEAAARYFGQEDPLGKIITLNRNGREYALEVTGIVERVSHSHFQFDMIVPLDFLLNDWQERFGNEGAEKKWFWTGTWTYVRFENQEAYQTVEAQLSGLVQKYFPPKWKEASILEMECIDRIHLNSDRLGEMEPNGSMTQVKIFSIIALVVLLIAVINFINLMSAQGMDRTKQVGVRKFLGALRMDIIRQYLLESVLLCLLAGLLAVVITSFLLLPEVNEVAGKALRLKDYLTPLTVASYLFGLLALGLMAGLYPAVLLSRFDALKILRGTLKFGKGGAILRQSFVIIQFISSVVLIVSVLVINSQREFIRLMDTGFDKENILVLEATESTNERLEAFKSEVARIPGVVSLAATLDIPGRGTSSIRFVPEGGTIEDPQQLPITYVDHDFLEATHLELAAGRFFDRSHPTDLARGFVINEKAARLLGWEGEAVGKKMEMFAPGSPEIEKQGEVIGVIKDYNFESIHHPIRPLVMIMREHYDYYLVKYQGTDLATLTASLEETWKGFDPNWPMESFLMDQNLEKRYDREDKLTRVTNYGMAFALLIAFIGIYGLSSFLISKRTKEVGVRRVLGSSLTNILAILSRSFVKLVLIANLLAWPLAFYLMEQWLNNFQYSIELSWMIFAFATLASLGLALAAIGYHTVKVSRTNPVKALRYE